MMTVYSPAALEYLQKKLHVYHAYFDFHDCGHHRNVYAGTIKQATLT
jgi:hypothetical protein